MELGRSISSKQATVIAGAYGNALAPTACDRARRRDKDTKRLLVSANFYAGSGVTAGRLTDTQMLDTASL